MQPNENGIYPGEEIIDSDLDDSEEEDEFAGPEDEDEDPEDDLTKDVMYCICDKVSGADIRFERILTDDVTRSPESRTSGRSLSETASSGPTARNICSTDAPG